MVAFVVVVADCRLTLRPALGRELARRHHGLILHEAEFWVDAGAQEQFNLVDTADRHAVALQAVEISRGEDAALSKLRHDTAEFGLSMLAQPGRWPGLGDRVGVNGKFWFAPSHAATLSTNRLVLGRVKR